MRDSNYRQYSADWLQHNRPQPMYDATINELYTNVFNDKQLVHNNNLIDEFKTEFTKFINGHTLSNYTGLSSFPVSDICFGCTQFIDDIYQRVGSNNVMIFENDYKYHWRLNNNIKYTTIDTLDCNKELIIAMPFPAYGDVHPQMSNILDKCAELQIPVHLDGAWISCSKNIAFNFDHPAISSVAISLSKGGLGADRIGVRYSRIQSTGAISLMNEFNMTSKSLLHLGIRYMQDVGPEYFWKKYENKYVKVCHDFNLTPTNAVHIAKTKDGGVVGVRPLLRC